MDLQSTVAAPPRLRRRSLPPPADASRQLFGA